MIGMAVAMTMITCLAQMGRPHEMASLVKEIVAKAEAGDTPYFAPKMDEHYAGRETNLVGMIRRSGMATNYPGRCTINTNGTGNLNYHYLEARCNFQIDVVKSNETWIIKRIWFCR